MCLFSLDSPDVGLLVRVNDNKGDNDHDASLE